MKREQERLGARLRAIRVERGLTLEGAGEKSGLHDGYIGRLERGIINPTLAVLVALAKAYRISVDDVFRDHPRQSVGPRPRKKNLAPSGE
ncbi:MAG: helix-turn-helix transcriptional regulator [Actinobacteria bacterium]|nr:helix-turn-helix transcriptional regulator [Actinomycetota bacterium]